MSALDRIAERTRLRASRLSRFMEALWRGDATSADQGLSIPPGEVRRRLLPPRAAADTRADFYDRDEVARALGLAIAEADAALADDADWCRVIDAFALSAFEADLLATALALHARPDFGRVFAYLADDVTAMLPSAMLVADLCDCGDDAALAPVAALRRWRLADSDPAAPIPALAGWRAAPVVAQALASGSWRDPVLEGHGVSLKPRGWRESMLRLDDDLAERAAARLATGQSVDLAGAPGSGRRTLAAQLALDRDEPLLLVDAPLLHAAPGEAADNLIAALRMAKFEGALICFAGAGAIPAELWQRVLPRDPLSSLPVVRCYEPGEAALHGVAALSLAPIALATRIALWRHYSEALPPSAITAARVTPGEIARLATGRARAGSDEPIPELLTRLPTPYDWDDLVLPPDTRTALKDFADQVRLRGAVLEGWGFDRLSHLGTGLVALFAGPSGVGKTMATQVLARDLGLELFRVDLAGIVDKYIGETEKKLRTAFAFAERPGVLLMFDEADALFGTRTQAKDSHDRYANLEINYLLQRIETFEGVAVLATNRKSELDTAFRRRLRTMIDFLQPGAAERLKLWQIALPEKAPSGERICVDIDHALLAERLSMTGADIKAAALGAAFLARAQGMTIQMPHVLAAAQREMAKHGQAMRLSIAPPVAPLDEAAAAAIPAVRSA